MRPVMPQSVGERKWFKAVWDPVSLVEWMICRESRVEKAVETAI